MHLEDAGRYHRQGAEGSGRKVCVVIAEVAGAVVLGIVGLGETMTYLQ